MASKEVLEQHSFFLTNVQETSPKPCDIVPCEVAGVIVFKMHCKLH